MSRSILHNPKLNGLKCICDYDDKEVEAMMLNSSWIKAAFVREPRERILSAYLNKVIEGNYFKERVMKNQSHSSCFLK